MKTTTTLAALAIALLPGFAFAQCAGKQMEQTAASCMAGTTWDAAKGACVETPSS
ncbi:adenylosuccinate lyase [Tabrizicola sp.]|uniref:adenylosuccinate lyase n=1 Tax=Tabrizicola sp. TaxID=2005166 RepID=UPI0035AFB95A